jgi:hypothetical protein
LKSSSPSHLLSFGEVNHNGFVFLADWDPFFDTISTEAGDAQLEKGSGKKQNWKNQRDKERKLDQQTFGMSYLPPPSLASPPSCLLSDQPRFFCSAISPTSSSSTGEPVFCLAIKVPI